MSKTKLIQKFFGVMFIFFAFIIVLPIVFKVSPAVQDFGISLDAVAVLIGSLLGKLMFAVIPFLIGMYLLKDAKTDDDSPNN